MNNILELLLKYSFHTFMTSSILFQLKSQSAREASHNSTFMGSHPTISHTFLALATRWMSSPSRKGKHGVVPRLHLIVFVFGVNQEKEEGGGVQDSPV